MYPYPEGSQKAENLCYPGESKPRPHILYSRFTTFLPSSFRSATSCLSSQSCNVHSFPPALHFNPHVRYIYKRTISNIIPVHKHHAISARGRGSKVLSLIHMRWMVVSWLHSPSLLQTESKQTRINGTSLLTNKCTIFDTIQSHRDN